MNEVAALAASKADAAAHGLKIKPQSAETKAIADRPPALDQPQEN